MKEKRMKVNIDGRDVTTHLQELDEQAYNYCLSGATNGTLTAFFGESVRRGISMADMKVA